MSAYADLLKILLSLGPKLPEIWTKLTAIWALVQEVLAIVRPAAQPGTLAIVDVTADEAALESQVALAIAGPGAAFDGSLLRRLFAFARDNPEFMAFLISLLRGQG